MLGRAAGRLGPHSPAPIHSSPSFRPADYTVADTLHTVTLACKAPGAPNVDAGAAGPSCRLGFDPPAPCALLLLHTVGHKPGLTGVQPHRRGDCMMHVADEDDRMPWDC